MELGTTLYTETARGNDGLQHTMLFFYCLWQRMQARITNKRQFELVKVTSFANGCFYGRPVSMG